MNMAMCPVYNRQLRYIWIWKENVLPTKNNLKYNTIPINCDCKCAFDEHYYGIRNARMNTTSPQQQWHTKCMVYSVIDALKRAITLYYNKRNQYHYLPHAVLMIMVNDQWVHGKTISTTITHSLLKRMMWCCHIKSAVSICITNSLFFVGNAFSFHIHMHVNWQL